MEAIDKIARELTGGGLRLTTRQTFQYHGILKQNVKPLIQGINEAFIDSIAACGDVNRNVLCNSNPLESDLHNQSTKMQQQLVRIYYHPPKLIMKYGLIKK